MSTEPTLSTAVFVYILELWKYVMILPDYSFKKKKKKNLRQNITTVVALFSPSIYELSRDI